jgi:hypothetical protein
MVNLGPNSTVNLMETLNFTIFAELVILHDGKNMVLYQYDCMS